MTVGRERAGAVDDRHLPALQQGLESARQAIDHLLLADLGDRHVQGRRRGLHTELGRVADGPVDLGGLQELLGRDATAVQAGAADAALLDHGDVQAGRSAVERSGVPAGTPTQYDEIELAHRGITLSVGHDADLHCERDEDREASQGGENQQGSRTHSTKR